jgi:two-component system sensor histidine kinase VicK
MFESFFALPLHFTVEFLGFLVAGGGALLVATRPALVPGPPSNRVSVALGLGVLAAAQVAHGGAFVEADGEQVLIVLRSLGLAFLLVGIVGGLRVATPTSLAAVKVAEPSLLVPAAASFLVAIMAGAGAARGGPKAMRRLAAAGLFLGIAELLTSIVPDEKFGTGSTDPYAYAAHAVKAIGFLAFGAWLWAGVRSSIRTRFVASFAALLVAVVLALSSGLTGVISTNLEREELTRVENQVVNAVQSFIQDDTGLLRDAASQISGSAITGQQVAARQDMDGFAQNDREIFSSDFVIFLHSSGELLGHAGQGPAKRVKRKPPPLTEPDVIKIIGTDVVQTTLSRPGLFPRASGPERIQDSIVLVAARGIRVPGRTVGFVAIGNWMDARTMEQISAAVEPTRASLVIGRTVVTELPGRPDASEVLPNRIRTELATGETLSEQQTIDDRSYFSAFAPLEADGIPVGATLVLSSPSRIVLATREDVTRIMFLVAMGVGVVALVLAWLSGHRITRPIQLLTKTAGAVREGDLQAKAEVSGDDEVGRLGETFNEMTDSLYRMTNDLRDAARQEHDLRDRIETIIQSMADGLVAVDGDRKIVLFNREAEALTGITAAGATGKQVEKVVDARNAQGEKVNLPIYELTEGNVGGVFLVRKSDNPVPVAVTSAVLRGEEGEITGAVAVLRNMTREHEVERMKSEFLSNISHELRTPLTPIKGYAEILGRKDVPATKTQQFARGILESTGRLERIVELLVDFAALEAGRLAPRTTPVDMGPLVAGLADEWGKRCPRHTLVADVTSKLPKVIGDERLLRRSLEELLDNAVKFSPHGGTIRLQAKGASSGNGRRRTVQVSVSDEGIGIAPDQLPQIFSDFHQLDGSETRSYGGLGLGLAFVRRIVEAHDGSVEVESELDRGTRLTITIPAAASRQEVDVND